MEINNQNNNLGSEIPASNLQIEPPHPTSKSKVKVVVSLIYIVVLFFGINLFWFVILNFWVGLPYFGLLVVNSIFAIIDLRFKDRFSTGYIYLGYIILLSLLLITSNLGTTDKSFVSQVLGAQLTYYLIGLLPFIISIVYKFIKFKKTEQQVVAEPEKHSLGKGLNNFFHSLITKDFYFRHKIIVALLIVVLAGFAGIKIAAGGAPVFSCQLRTMNAVAGLDQQNVLSCSGEVGTQAISPSVCSVFFTNFEAKDYCLNRYAVEHNKPEICKSLPDTLTFEQPGCYQDLAIKNKDIRLCNNMSGFNQETCQNAVRYQMFYSGPNASKYTTAQGTWDPCPGDDPAYWIPGNEQVCHARKDPAFTACLDEKDVNKQPDCYLNVALQKQDPQFCKAIDSKDYQSNQCYFKIAQAANNISYCNLIPGDDPAIGILSRAECYRAILGLPEGLMDNSTAACETIVDFNNKNNCHAMLSYLTAYYGMLYLTADQRTEGMYVAIRESAGRKCEAMTDDKLKEWCHTTIANYILHTPTPAEPSNFPGIATTTTASIQFTTTPATTGLTDKTDLNSLPSCTITDSSNWKVYKNNLLNFQTEYPDNYTPQVDSAVSDSSKQLVHFYGVGCSNQAVTIETVVNPSNSLEGYWANTSYGGEKSRKTISLNGNSAYQISLNNGQIITSFYRKSDSQVFIITLWDIKHSDSYIKMLSNFNF
jgi:hypothetical protein